MTDQIPPELFENQEALHRFYWQQGCLRYLLHPDLQKRVYDFTHSWKEAHPNSAKPIVWDLHRAAGKTYMLSLMCVERAMRLPAQEIRFGAETEGKCEQIVEPNFRKIFENLPEDFKAEYKRDKASPYYELYNPTWPSGSYPSRIWIIGCRERADIHRGKRSHMIALDECREIDAFEYVAKVVFGPHFATMDNPVYIMSSTPPESMDHAWSRIYCREAMDDDRYFIGKSIDDKDWKTEDDERMLELFHSRDSSEWRREMLCEHISDPTRLLIPEFDEDKHTAKEYERPQHILPLIVADGGYIDYFAALFGYVDFQRQRLIVEESIIVNRKNLGDLSVLISAMKSSLYGEFVLGRKGDIEVVYPVKPRQYADMKPIELATLSDVYGLHFVPPEERHDPDALIAHCRDRFFKNQIIILKKNETLIRQLKNAIRDEKGKLTRSTEYGHWDAVMAMVYMARSAPWRVNPGYENQKYDWKTHQIPKGAFREKGPTFTRDNVQKSLRKRWLK